MPDDAIGYAFNDKAATMSITVLNLTEASALLRTINKRDIKDVRAIDLDLALVLESGHKIIISRGAVAAVNSPQLILEFADGDIALGDVFEKLNHIEVPADAAVTVTSKEITRYGIKRVVKPKVARNKQDQEADQDKKDEEDSAKSDADEARPAESLAGHDGSGGSDIPARKFTSGKGSSSSLALQELADAPTDAGSSKGGISWPVIAGGLGLLAAAGGGGGGGGGGTGAGAGSGGGSGGGVATTLSGAAALGPLNNATITAYDAEGRVIGKAVPVINGRYTLVLDQSGYKGLILLAIRDNTPGVRDNYADEASVSITDLGSTVLRAVALADGSNQIINVTALTELAALKAGLGTGQTNLAAAQVGATTVADLIGTPVEADYLPAILRAIAATADPDKVNQALGLGKLIDSAKQAAERALAKARIYGDNDANPALTAADFADMGIPGSDHPGTLTLANAALKVLPDAQSHTIPAVRTIVQAAARVAALADGGASNTADAALPDAATYTTLGITTSLTPAARPAYRRVSRMC